MNTYDEEKIRTKAATQAYRDNWDRIFGEKPAGDDTVEVLEIHHKDEDAIEGRLTAYVYWCEVCQAHFVEPHVNGHAVIKVDEAKKCTGFYNQGTPGAARCQNREGCGLEGCPAADFGNTHDNPSVPKPER